MRDSRDMIASIPGMGTRMDYMDKVEEEAAAQAARIEELDEALTDIIEAYDRRDAPEDILEFGLESAVNAAREILAGSGDLDGG